MANTLKLGAGKWATGTDTVLAFNDENNNFKPLAFDFSRASSATVVNQSGLIETVGSGEPRIDFLGNTKGALLLEPTRTNLFEYSESFSNSYWTKNGITESIGYLAPDGTLNAYKLIANAVDSSMYEVFSVTSGTTYSLSFYLKTVSGTLDTTIGLGSPGFPQNEGDGGRYKNITVTNEWKRYTLTSTADATASSGISFGGFSGFTTGEEVLIYGAQLEVGSYATSYIPTSGSAVTRVAETSSQTLPNSVFNSYPFSVFAEVDVVNTNTGSAFSLLNKASSNNYFTIEYFSNVWHITARPNGAVQRITSTSTVTKGTHKLVGVLESTSMKLYLNGSLIASGSNSQSFNINVDSLLLGQLRISGDTGTRNTVIQTDLYNTALTDAEAIALTTI